MADTLELDSLNDLVKKASSVSSRFVLEGKNALVVGGTKGLGQAMALGLAGAGADVCVAARSKEEGEQTADAIKKLGKKGLFYAVDVTLEDSVKTMADNLSSQFGNIDILVNSQGLAYLQDSVDFDLEKWSEVLDVNLKSVMLCCKHFGRGMLSRGYGKIINVSSVRGFQGRARDLAYAPSKGAVNQLTRSLAIEWGPKGINVNGLAPVFTKTAMSMNILADPEVRNWVLGRIAMHRLGELEDVFGPVIFLASSASNFVNGHTLPVEGGWLAA